MPVYERVDSFGRIIFESKSCSSGGYDQVDKVLAVTPLRHRALDIEDAVRHNLGSHNVPLLPATGDERLVEGMISFIGRWIPSSCV